MNYKTTHFIDIFPESLHVSRIRISLPISDRIIWEYAKKNDLVIVTSDDLESLAEMVCQHIGYPTYFDLAPKGWEE